MRLLLNNNQLYRKYLMSQNRIITEEVTSPLNQEVNHHLQQQNPAEAVARIEEEMNNFIDTLPPEEQSSWHKNLKPIIDKMEQSWGKNQKSIDHSWEVVSSAILDFLEQIKPLVKKLDQDTKKSWQDIEKGCKKIESYCQTKGEQINTNLHQAAQDTKTWATKMKNNAKNTMDKMSR